MKPIKNVDKFDITLVNYSLPPISSDVKNRIISVPRGVLILVSILENAGFLVQFKDYQLSNVDKPGNVKSFCSFLEGTADIIGISSSYHLLPKLVKSIEIFKEKYPHKKVILGGPAIATLGYEILCTFKFIDFVLEGEAEESIRELVKALKNKSSLDSIKGLVYRKDRKIINTFSEKLRIKNLESLPLPAYDKLPKNKYNNFTVETVRGCPHSCTFCNIPNIKGNRIYARKIESVVEEIDLIHKRFNINKIRITDDTFTWSKKRVTDFCNAVSKKNYKMEYGIYSRIDIMDEELMHILSKSGCNYVFFGVESGSNEILSKLNKGFKIEDILSKLAKSKDYFQKVVASLIWNFPFESLDNFMETLKITHFLLKNQITVLFYELTPYPATKIYNKHQHNIYYDPENHYSIGDSWYKTKEFSNETKNLIRDYPKIFSGFYSYKSPNEELKRNLFYLFLRFKNDLDFFSDILIKFNNKCLTINKEVLIFGDYFLVDLDNISKFFEKMKIRLSKDPIYISFNISNKDIDNQINTIEKLNLVVETLDNFNIEYKIVNPIPECVNVFSNLMKIKQNQIFASGIEMDMENKRLFIKTSEIKNYSKLRAISNDLSFEIISKKRKIVSKKCTFCYHRIRNKDYHCYEYNDQKEALLLTN